MMSQGIKMHDFHDYQSIFQGLKRHCPCGQGSHQNAFGPVGAFFVSIVNTEVIHQTFLVLNVRQELKQLLGKDHTDSRTITFS